MSVVIAHTVTARKRFRCDGYAGGDWCRRPILPGDDYVRHVAMPGHECNDGPAPRVLRLCAPCRAEQGKPMPPRRTRAAATGGAR